MMIVRFSCCEAKFSNLAKHSFQRKNMQLRNFRWYRFNMQRRPEIDFTVKDEISGVKLTTQCDKHAISFPTSVVQKHGQIDTGTLCKNTSNIQLTNNNYCIISWIYLDMLYSTIIMTHLPTTISFICNCYMCLTPPVYDVGTSAVSIFAAPKCGAFVLNALCRSQSPPSWLYMVGVTPPTTHKYNSGHFVASCCVFELMDITGVSQSTRSAK